MSRDRPWPHWEMWLRYEPQAVPEDVRERYTGYRHVEAPALPPGACPHCGAPAGVRCDAGLHS
jgi:hypothetical protein